MMDPQKVRQIIEAALVCADSPMTLDAIVALFRDDEFEDDLLDRELIKNALTALAEDCDQRGIELKKVASGYRLQVKQEFSPWVGRMMEDKPPRYTRALLETLSLVAYKQPVTRGDIEQVRGVSVSTNIMRTLIERNWVRVVGHREVPGRPAMYGTTKAFLDYFNLKTLAELPTLADIRALTEPLAETENVDYQPRPSLSLPEEDESELNELGVEVNLEMDSQNVNDDSKQPLLEDQEPQVRDEQSPDRTLADVVEFPRTVFQSDE